MSLLYKLIDSLFVLMQLIVLARVFISWLPVNRNGRFAVLLYQITEPVFVPIRRMLERTPFGHTYFDFTPVVALILIYIARQIVMTLLF